MNPSSPAITYWRAAADAALDRAEAALRRLSPVAFGIAATVGALGIAMFFFSPYLAGWRTIVPASAEWARAHGVWQQAQAPWDLSADIEPALRWRLLPAMVIHALGGGMGAVVALPWAGLLLLVFATARYLDRLLASRTAALLGTVLLATTGGVLTLTSYHGINDAWFLLALGVAATARSPAALLLAGLAGPWIDERFILALPLAWLCRGLNENASPVDRRRLSAAFGGTALYLAIRLVAALTGHEGAAAGHISKHFAYLDKYIIYGPLGWWMGFRLGWILPVLTVALLWVANRRLAAWITLFALGGMTAVTLVAADLTRSTDLLLPLFITGLPFLQRQLGSEAFRLLLLGLVAGNLLSPFSWVTYQHNHLLWPLPVELVRLFRQPLP